MDNHDFQMWKFVLSVSEAIASESHRVAFDKGHLVSYLAAIEEGFGQTSDPVSDFHGFVLLNLCRSVRQALEKQAAGP